MTIEMKTEFGTIDVTKEVVATIVGGVVIDCEGIVGMASQKQIKDGISELLGKENFQKGIIIREEAEEVHIDLYIIVSYGTNISALAKRIQTRVKQQIEQMLGLELASINIYVQGVRLLDE